MFQLRAVNIGSKQWNCNRRLFVTGMTDSSLGWREFIFFEKGKMFVDDAPVSQTQPASFSAVKYDRWH